MRRNSITGKFSHKRNSVAYKSQKTTWVKIISPKLVRTQDGYSTSFLTPSRLYSSSFEWVSNCWWAGRYLMNSTVCLHSRCSYIVLQGGYVPLRRESQLNWAKDGVSIFCVYEEVGGNKSKSRGNLLVPVHEEAWGGWNCIGRRLWQACCTQIWCVVLCAR